MMWSCKRLSFLRHLLPYICKLHLRVLELFSLLYMLQNHHKTVKKKKGGYRLQAGSFVAQHYK